MKNHRGWQCVFIAVVAIAMSLGLVLILGVQAPVRASTVFPPADDGAEGTSYIYRFDPNTSSFVFTFTVPTRGANPRDVIVSGMSPLNVWFTEPGVDRIGRLTYTDTQDYAFREYTVTVGSYPLNLVSDQGFIWFTAAGGDYIGRLDPATGQIDEFVAPEGSYPADLDVASDGSIWFTEMTLDQVAHLVVTSTSDYTITEYTCDPLSGGRPYGIVVVGESIYLAQTVNDRVTRFTPPDSWVHIHSFVNPDVPNEPYVLARDTWGRVWGTERAGNRVSYFSYGTLPIVTGYELAPAASLPTGLVADANNHLWFTQSYTGQIGRLIPGGYPQKDYFPLPLKGLVPTGVATDDVGNVWVLASRPYRVYLPTIIRF